MAKHGATAPKGGVTGCCGQTIGELAIEWNSRSPKNKVDPPFPVHVHREPKI